MKPCESVTFVLLIEKKSGKPEPGECLPPDYLLPGCKDRPLVPLHPIHKELKVQTGCMYIAVFSLNEVSQSPVID